MTNVSQRYACPCCGNKTLSEVDVYEICDICGWEDDPTQRNDPEFEGGANNESLSQAREMWLSQQK
jgi:hypothetical protein